VLLQIENLTKEYRAGVRANDDVSFEVDSGQLLGLFGHNGTLTARSRAALSTTRYPRPKPPGSPRCAWASSTTTCGNHPLTDTSPLRSFDVRCASSLEQPLKRVHRRWRSISIEPYLQASRPQLFGAKPVPGPFGRP